MIRSSAEPRAPATGSPRPLATSSWVTMWTSRSGPDSRATVAPTPGPKNVPPGLAARGAQHDLGGVHPGARVEQRDRYVVADDVVEGAAQVLHQCALDRQFLGEAEVSPSLRAM